MRSSDEHLNLLHQGFGHAHRILRFACRYYAHGIIDRTVTFTAHTVKYESIILIKEKFGKPHHRYADLRRKSGSPLKTSEPGPLEESRYRRICPIAIGRKKPVGGLDIAAGESYRIGHSLRIRREFPDQPLPLKVFKKS